jgi:hypothetical protein
VHSLPRERRRLRERDTSGESVRDDRMARVVQPDVLAAVTVPPARIARRVDGAEGVAARLRASRVRS